MSQVLSEHQQLTTDSSYSNYRHHPKLSSQTAVVTTTIIIVDVVVEPSETVFYEVVSRSCDLRHVDLPRQLGIDFGRHQFGYRLWWSANSIKYVITN